MKIVYISLFCLLALVLFADAPAPPGNPTNPLVPPQAPVLVTNVTLVYTNCAVKTPLFQFDNVTIYGDTNAFKGATVIAWNPSTDPAAGGYRLRYGPTTTTVTNTLNTVASVSTVLFYSVLDTNLIYWMNVTVVSTNGVDESAPTSTILVQPTP